jgi:uncharacterized membrane protein HdeD (DUF308 family)
MRFPIGWMITASVLAIVVGMVMLLYPGGTMQLMSAAFTVLQAMLSIFVMAAAISEGIRCFRTGRKGTAVAALLVGLVATLLIWFFDVGIIYLIVAFFCVLAGLGEIVGAVSVPQARYFLWALGLMNIMVGVIILRYPVALSLLIAWYVLFWGVTRLMLSLELRRIEKAAN